MTQIKNRFEMQNLIDERGQLIKKLPNFFNEDDEIKPFGGLVLSVLFHCVFIICAIVISLFWGLVFPHLEKPKLPVRDVEFKLVQNESKPPINKNTKIRSDRDSQAGGKHDPKKPISEPQPVGGQKTKPAPQIQTKPVQKPTVKPAPSPIQKLIKQTTPTKPVVQEPVKQIKTPTAPKAPSAPLKPSIKPAPTPAGTAKPTAPKPVAAPKSPFTVAAPSSKAPVGATYKPQGVSGGSSTASSGSSSGAPAPKFSSSSGSSSGGSSSGGSYASRGTTGGSSGGSAGNPSPGNPYGKPGIDAIRQPNWGPYMRDLEARIKRNWSPPKGDTSKRVVITFVIGRDGRLLSKQITKSSGVPLADRAAMSAIELTAPFRPLPPEFKGQSVPIEFTFDYNVLNSVLK